MHLGTLPSRGTHQTSHVSWCLQAYADYNDLMSMTETMISEMVKEIKGSYKIQYHANGPEADPVEIDFTPPWRRVSMIEELEKVLGVKIPTDLYSDGATEFLKKLCKEKEIECSPPHVRAPRPVLLWRVWRTASTSQAQLGATDMQSAAGHVHVVRRV